MNNPLVSSAQNESVDIVDVIRNLRNDLIKDFLDERNLLAYVSDHYKVHEVSAIKMEFIKKDLKSLLISPVNLEWYKPVITDFNANGSASISEGNEKLFYQEIEGILKRNLYA